MGGSPRGLMAAGVCGALLLLAAFVTPARGQPPAAAASPATDVPPGEMQRRAYVNACRRGNARMAQSDAAGALAEYRAAIAVRRDDPQAHYLLGVAERALGEATEAEAEWNRALALSDRDPPVRTRILAALAQMKEQAQAWPEALQAWQRVGEAASAAGDEAAAATARAREEAIARVRQQDEAYEIVRRRIAETADGGVYSTVPDAGK